MPVGLCIFPVLALLLHAWRNAGLHVLRFLPHPLNVVGMEIQSGSTVSFAHFYVGLLGLRLLGAVRLCRPFAFNSTWRLTVRGYAWRDSLLNDDTEADTADV